MPRPPSDPLAQRRCRPCEGGVDKLTRPQAEQLLQQVPQWQIDPTAEKLTRRWRFDDFAAAMRFLNQVAEVAEDQQHHPDLQLSGYRHVQVDLTTHAIGGLSENDFIVAAQIDQLPLDSPAG